MSRSGHVKAIQLVAKLITCVSTDDKSLPTSDSVSAKGKNLKTQAGE